MTTLKVRSKALNVSNELAEEIRKGRTTIVLPLLSKNLIRSGSYYYLKENVDGQITTKDTAITFVEIKSSKVLAVQNLTTNDIEKLNLKVDFKTYYSDIIQNIVNETAKTMNSFNRMMNIYKYEANPNIEYIELEVVTPDEDDE